MQGINPLTMQCTYKTPCGWCAKWDKKCDKKIPSNTLDDIIDVPLVYGICFNCVVQGNDMPQCKTCNPGNDFKNFIAKENK